MATNGAWSISGSYFEACNCEAVCPCRRQNGVPGGRSTYGVCQFILSWHIIFGHFGEIDLSGNDVVMSGFYDDDEGDDAWSIKLFVDHAASEAQMQAEEQIFLGRAGGDILFTANIATILEVKRAAIALDHRTELKSIRIAGTANSSALRPAAFNGIVSCGIPGHDHPGTEYISSLRIDDAPLNWSYDARCGFATEFAYRG